MALYCTKCYNSFDRETVFFKDGETICPIESCGGNLVVIDDLILPTIILLNKNGLTTQFSCSGHYMRETHHALIVFEKTTINRLAELFKNLPQGWEICEIWNGRPCLEYVFKKEKSERYFEILQANADLFKYCLKIFKCEGVEQ